MPRIKIVMPANPTAIQNKQGTAKNEDITAQDEQRLDTMVQDVIENTPQVADIITTIHDIVKERSYVRKSR